jgi:fluoroquinolone transport system ATP-binding protein
MIQVNNLNFTYEKSGKHAIKGIDFHIKKGEIFGFLGPSGAGKTTTQRLIIGLLRGYHGSIKVFDQERSLWKKDFYERIGVAFDFPNLYIKLTAEENLKLIGSYYKYDKIDTDNLLDQVGLLKDKNRRVEGFSKGMKMRLNFVRAIMHNPDIIFFDEPTSGLDPVNAKIIKDKLLEMRADGKTIFLTTHNMTVAEQLCDRVSFINDGILSTTDSPKNLMISHGEPQLLVEYLKGKEIVQVNYNLDHLNSDLDFKNVIDNHKIITMHSKEATLEEIFIQVTGRGLI